MDHGGTEEDDGVPVRVRTGVRTSRKGGSHGGEEKGWCGNAEKCDGSRQVRDGSGDEDTETGGNAEAVGGERGAVASDEGATGLPEQERICVPGLDG